MKIYLESVGCRLNHGEIESMARQLRAAGHEIVAAAEHADLAVVNTCAVTGAAASDSRGKIRHIARDGVSQIIPTGCWATLQPREAASLPNVLRVVGNDRKDQLFQTIAPAPEQVFGSEPLIRELYPRARQRTRAFIKVQDGCDNRCTFCVTTLARGAARSRKKADVINEIQHMTRRSVKEIVLTGVHLGSWGQDFGRHLRELVADILDETDTARLRLSSLEPWDLDEDFFRLWENKRLMPQLHLPLQSGCAATLKRMARKTSPESFHKLVTSARRMIPEVAITTDLIAGFPGETEAEFSETLKFVREMNFAGGHVFTYSARPGTGAARMTGQIRHQTRKERNHLLRQTLDESTRFYRDRFIGRRMTVLWESTTKMGEDGWQLEGLTGNYIRVTAFAPTPRWNILDDVKLTGWMEGGLSGEIL